MSDEMNELGRRVVLGRMNRRDFLGRAAALGVSATAANTLLAGVVRAEGPQKGGILKAGMQGGAATDSLDPAVWASQVPYFFGRQWGEQLVQISPDGEVKPALAEEWGASDDAKMWTFKIRKGVQFHDGKTMTPEDVVATMERHSDEKSKSGALGFMERHREHQGQRRGGRLHTEGCQCRSALSARRLSPDRSSPTAARTTRLPASARAPTRLPSTSPACAIGGEKFRQLLARQPRLRRPDRDHRHQRCDRAHLGPAGRPGRHDQPRRAEDRRPDQARAGRHHPATSPVAATTSSSCIATRRHSTTTICRHGAEVRDRPRGDAARRSCVATARSATTSRSTRPIRCSPTTSSSASSIPRRRPSTTRSRAIAASVLLRTSDVAFPGAVDAAQLYQQSAAKAGITLEVKREPGDGYWSEVWNKQPFSASYWGGRPTQDQMYSTAYYSTAEWNDTRFLRADFDKMVLAGPRRARPEPSARRSTATWAMIVRDEGGVIRRCSTTSSTRAAPRSPAGSPTAPGDDERLRAVEVLARRLIGPASG